MKSTLRKELIKKRRSLSDADWKNMSLHVLEHIQSSNLINDMDTIMIFLDFRKEVETRPIIEWLWSMGKTVVIPRVAKDSPILELCVIHQFEEMDLSPLGILEPKQTHNDFTSPDKIDFVFMPGVAFTKRGERLGYGGGYYDQLIPLMKKDTPLVAIAFDLQIIDSIPVEAHDILVHKIITEKGVIDCSSH